MAQRQGRGEPTILTTDELVEIQRITGEIMDVIPATARHERLRHDITEILVRNIARGIEEHEKAMLAEETHKWMFGSHHISQCRIDWCGRYRGQRR